MAIRWSPGCNCCGDPTGCQGLQIPYTPTSSLSRGEWADTAAWEPLTLYNPGDVFLQPRLGDGRMVAWTPSDSIMSGVQWDQTEQDRYVVQGITDIIDEVTEWDIFGFGWDELSPSQKEDALATGKLYENCGFISRGEVLPTTDLDWYAYFGVSLNPDPLLADISYQLIAKTTGGEAAVSLDVDKLTEAEWPPSPENHPVAFPWKASITISEEPVDTTWYQDPGLPPPYLAHTRQPLESSVIGFVDLTAEDPLWQSVPFWEANNEYQEGDRFREQGSFDNRQYIFEAPSSFVSGPTWDITEESRYFRRERIPEHYLGLIDNVLHSSIKVVGGPGILHGLGYDARDPATFIIANDGDLVVRRSQVVGDINGFEVILAQDVVEELMILGGGMQEYSPGGIPSGRNIAVYVAGLEFSDQTSSPFGLQLSGAQTQRTRTYSEPTCLAVHPTACPCPLEAEFYPIQCPAEGIDNDTTVAEKAFAIYRAEPALLDAVFITIVGPDGQFLRVEQYPPEELISSSLMGSLSVACRRIGICHFEFSRAAVWEYVKLGGRGDPSVGGDPTPIYQQYLTVSVERISIRWEPLRGRFVKVTTDGSVFVFGTLSRVSEGNTGNFYTIGELTGLHQVEAFVSGSVWAGDDIGSNGTVVAGREIVEVPWADFTCSGYSITGRYTVTGLNLPFWTNIIDDPDDNPLLGDEWTVTM